MAKVVLSVGFMFPGGFTEFVPLDSRRSLLDADVVVFRPSIDPWMQVESHYQGRPSLYDSASFELKNASSHWRQQIQMAVTAGKNVFVFFSRLCEVWVDTGQKTYSGTGRNARATRHVESYTNYMMLPSFAGRILEGEGTQMSLAKSGQWIADYWHQFGARSAYRVTFDELKVTATVTTASGKVPVACSFGLKGGAGRVVGLPALADYDIDPTDVEEPIKWTKDDKRFGQDLLNALLAIDTALHSAGAESQPPAWTSRDEFVVPGELELKRAILGVDGQVEQLLSQKTEFEKKLSDETRLRRLLYETGRSLESSIIEVLKLMGFVAEPFQKADSEFDAVFVSAEGRFIGEVEGKDSKAINIDKLRQLEMNVQEDFARDDVSEPANGVLFGNAFRLMDPDERPTQQFTDKCLIAARRSGTALVRTIDLFQVGRALRDTPDAGYATRCRQALLERKGKVVEFPTYEEPANLALRPTAERS